MVSYSKTYHKAFKSVIQALPGWYFPDNLEEIGSFLDKNYNGRKELVYPMPEEVLRCFYNLSPIDIKVVILGQDPYHTPGVANGLAFSTKQEKIPPSLKNIFKELENDLNIRNTNGNLYNWKKQGVLLLNTSLSVHQGKAGSHSELWDGFTKKILNQLLRRNKEPRVYVLWGANASSCFHSCEEAINFDNFKDIKVLTSSHPSPFSADKGFFGSKPFSKINAFLRDKKIEEIDWRT